jgi:hypothetical protein
MVPLEIAKILEERSAEDREHILADESFRDSKHSWDGTTGEREHFEKWSFLRRDPLRGHFQGQV